MGLGNEVNATVFDSASGWMSLEGGLSDSSPLCMQTL